MYTYTYMYTHHLGRMAVGRPPPALGLRDSHAAPITALPLPVRHRRLVLRRLQLAALRRRVHRGGAPVCLRLLHGRGLLLRGPLGRCRRVLVGWWHR